MTIKKRRNSEEVDEAIFRATKELIEEFGFAKLTLTQVAKKAQLTPNMFYKRYPDLDKLLWDFVRKYDYWFTDVINIEFHKSDPYSYYTMMLEDLVGSLSVNNSMQELLKYELTNDNPLTRRTAGLRELDTGAIMAGYEKYFEGSTIDIRTNTAIIISGIYYLILHRKLSTFCGVDFSTSEGIERLRKSVIDISNKIFEIRNIDNKIKQIARDLLKNGVDKAIVAKSTGLSLKEVAELE